MIQLSFQPAFDPLHGVFGLLRLWPILSRGPLLRDTLRILDFYLVFPFRIKGIRLTRGHAGYRKLASTYEHKKPYGEQPEDRTVFSRMTPIQEAAVETLATHGLIDSKQLGLGWVQITGQPLPDDIVERVEAANAHDADLIHFLGILVSGYELSGKNGLKDRTGLLEYRYDSV